VLTANLNCSTAGGPKQAAGRGCPVQKYVDKRSEEIPMAHEVTLITGDGTGPELAEAARKCVDATGVAINWDVREAGVDVMEREGTPIPDGTIESVRRTKCALKAPITTPVGTGFRSINVYLRQELGLFACIRPC